MTDLYATLEEAGCLYKIPSKRNLAKALIEKWVAQHVAGPGSKTSSAKPSAKDAKK